MEDNSEAQSKLVTLLREDRQAVPFIIGYLTHEIPVARLERAIQSYLEYNEKTEILLAARRKAKQDTAQSTP